MFSFQQKEINFNGEWAKGLGGGLPVNFLSSLDYVVRIASKHSTIRRINTR